MKSISRTAVYILVIILTSCTPALQVNHSDTALKEDVEQIIQERQISFDNDMEKQIVTQQLFGFFSFIKQTEGEQRWAAFMNDYQRSGSIFQSIYNTYDCSLYALVADLFQQLEQSTSSVSSGEMRTETMGPFELHYVSGTAAERDLPKVKYLLEKYTQTIGTFFFSEENKRNNFERNIDNLSGHRVQLYLLSDQKSIQQQFGDTSGLAAALISHKQMESGKYQLSARILLKYFDLFSIQTLTHELAHIYWAFTDIKPKYTTPMTMEEITDNLSEIEKSFAGLTQGGQFIEGVAEYVTAQESLLYQYGLFDTAHAQIAEYMRRTDLELSIDELDKRIYDRDYPGYELAHSLFTYLIESEGKQAALELSYTNGSNDAFLTSLGKSRNEVTMGWRQRVQ